jgi:hypothetical protein
MKDWVKLSAGEQHFIKMVLAFFAARYRRRAYSPFKLCCV